MLHALLVFASEEETSKTPFYVAGTVLAVWAVLVAFAGIRRHEGWPERKPVRNALIGISALLVALTAAASILTG